MVSSCPYLHPLLKHVIVNDETQKDLIQGANQDCTYLTLGEDTFFMNDAKAVTAPVGALGG